MGEVSLFQMRDNHDKLPEILKAFEREGQFFCVVQLERAGETRSYRFGVSRDGYLAVKRLLELRPFDQMPGLLHRYFFVPAFRVREDAGLVEIAIRVEQGHHSKQVEVEAPRDLAANLKWFFELEDWSKADHLRENGEQKS
jgi:hypothetical protein